MNYLAHAYLSFGHEDILTGNMISDFIKGKKKFDYSNTIQQGIVLHRAIDHFTDTHPVTTQSKQLFKPAVGTYAGAFMDIVYDHFLAADKHIFNDEQALLTFTANTYQLLRKNHMDFPEKFAKMFPYMQEQNWLYNYRFEWGIEKSFGGLVRRAAYLDDASGAFAIFLDQYDRFREYYEQFFPDLKAFVLLELKKIGSVL